MEWRFVSYSPERTGLQISTGHQTRDGQAGGPLRMAGAAASVIGGTETAYELTEMVTVQLPELSGKKLSFTPK